MSPSPQILQSVQNYKLPDWVTALTIPTPDQVFAVTASGHLAQITPTGKEPKLTKIHESTISAIQTSPTNSNLIFTASNDHTLKIHDIRLGKPIITLKHSHPFFCLDVSPNGNLVAAGSELAGNDVHLPIWDIRKLQSNDSEEPMRTFIDSHNDDITTLRFHPNRNVLLSGGTDGLINLYDLDVIEEEDAMIQCINWCSVSSAGFLNTNRIWAKSHMETFATFEISKPQEIDPDSVVNDHSDLNLKKSKDDKDYGDIRESWKCNYIIDIKAPYMALGGEEKIMLREFNPDSENLENKEWHLAGGHGEEIVRDVCINGGIWTAGEDCYVRYWGENEKVGLYNTKSGFVSSEPFTEVAIEEGETMEIEYDTKKVKEKKDKHKSKKSKKDKKDRHRFKPY
ncbi:hypothetical protein DAMA08_030790 [Martiniozyma asiatica (nom. inval.)]|nr:hypothetical protein DAMA08_030790 [Martiniozyma asiatica]